MVATRRILVIDDEPTVTKSCRRILASEGNEVEIAESGQDGLRRALSEHFDVVMTDLKMPDMDGMELVRTLRRDRPETGIVVITGYGTIPSAVSAMKLGALDYIEKPFTPVRIVEAARKAFSAGQAKSEIRAEMVRAVVWAARRGEQGPSRESSRVLSGLALSPAVGPATVSREVAWIEKESGELSDEERGWLKRRLESEIC